MANIALVGPVGGAAGFGPVRAGALWAPSGNFLPRCAWATWSRHRTDRASAAHAALARSASSRVGADGALRLSARGYFARHLRRMRQHFRKRRELLSRELHPHLGGLLKVAPLRPGCSLSLAPAGKDDRRAAELAAQVGIQVLPISTLSLEPLFRGD